MSYYETPEQRQIRELRNQISTLQNQSNYESSANAALRNQLEQARRQQQIENNRLAEKMRNIQAQANKERANMTESIRSLDAELKEKERLSNQKIVAMQQQHQAQIQNIESTFRAEQQTLNNEIQQTRNEMREGIFRLRAETDRKLQEQRNESQRMIEQVNRNLQNEINVVDAKVNSIAQSIAQKEENSRNLAVYWTQEAARLYQQINECFHSQLINEKQNTYIHRRIDNANSSIESGQYESAITDGRNAFFAALDLKEELATAELKWNLWFNSIITREQQLWEALASAKSRGYEIELNGEKIHYNNGIDYWTNGQLSIFDQQVEKLRKRLENIDAMTLEQLQESEKQIRTLQEQLALIENVSHINVAMSVSRYEMACKIGEILGDSFAMVDSDGEYFAEEDREEYHAIFENPVTHQQIAVVITPIADETGAVSNHVDLIVGNLDNDPIKRDRMTRQVATQLNDSGVENCKFPCASRFNEQTSQEVARVGDIEAVQAGDEKTRANLPDGVKRNEKIPSNVTRRTV